MMKPEYRPKPELPRGGRMVATSYRSDIDWDKAKHARVPYCTPALPFVHLDTSSDQISQVARCRRTNQPKRSIPTEGKDRSSSESKLIGSTLSRSVRFAPIHDHTDEETVHQLAQTLPRTFMQNHLERYTYATPELKAQHANRYEQKLSVHLAPKVTETSPVIVLDGENKNKPTIPSTWNKTTSFERFLERQKLVNPRIRPDTSPGVTAHIFSSRAPESKSCVGNPFNRCPTPELHESWVRRARAIPAAGHVKEGETVDQLRRSSRNPILQTSPVEINHSKRHIKRLSTHSANTWSRVWHRDEQGCSANTWTTSSRSAAQQPFSTNTGIASSSHTESTRATASTVLSTIGRRQAGAIPLVDTVVSHSRYKFPQFTPPPFAVDD